MAFLQIREKRKDLGSSSSDQTPCCCFFLTGKYFFTQFKALPSSLMKIISRKPVSLTQPKAALKLAPSKTGGIKPKHLKCTHFYSASHPFSTIHLGISNKGFQRPLKLNSRPFKLTVLKSASPKPALRNSFHTGSFQNGFAPKPFNSANSKRKFASQGEPSPHWKDPLLFEQTCLTEEERMIKDQVYNYCQDKLMPRVQQAYRNETFDVEIFKEMGSLGMLGSAIEGYGKSSFCEESGY